MPRSTNDLAVHDLTTGWRIRLAKRTSTSCAQSEKNSFTDRSTVHDLTTGEDRPLLRASEC